MVNSSLKDHQNWQPGNQKAENYRSSCRCTTTFIPCTTPTDLSNKNDVRCGQSINNRDFFPTVCSERKLISQFCSSKDSLLFNPSSPLLPSCDQHPIFFTYNLVTRGPHLQDSLGRLFFTRKALAPTLSFLLILNFL